MGARRPRARPAPLTVAPGAGSPWHHPSIVLVIGPRFSSLLPPHDWSQVPTTCRAVFMMRKLLSLAADTGSPLCPPNALPFSGLGASKPALRFYAEASVATRSCNGMFGGLVASCSTVFLRAVGECFFKSTTTRESGAEQIRLGSSARVRPPRAAATAHVPARRSAAGGGAARPSVNALLNGGQHGFDGGLSTRFTA